MRKRHPVVALLVLVALASFASPSAADEPWQFTLTPYLWFPTIDGNANFDLPPGSGDGRFAVRVGPVDYLSRLKSALMVAGQARKGPYSLGTDLIYLNFGHEDASIRSIDFGSDHVPVDASINSTTTSSFRGLAWTFTGGRTINQNPDSPFDVIAGFRYFGVDTSADWQLTGTITGPGGTRTFPRTGSISQQTALWDGLLGFRGHAKVGERWTVPYYADIGAGTSKLTWQALAGVTYSYHWGDVGVVYRRVAYDQGKNGLLQDFSFSGTAATVSFHF